MNQSVTRLTGTIVDLAVAPRDRLALLRLLQFGDSALPIGAFSFSNGLESATALRLVHDTATLEAFLATALRTSATSDGIGLLCACRSAAAGDLAALVETDAAIYARKLNEETRLMTVRMGRKLSELAVAVVADPLCAAWLERIRDGGTPGTHAASLAAAVVAMKVSAGDAFAVQQYGAATTILGAALRLMRISFVETQTILWRAMAAVPATYERVADATLDDMAGFAPANDILAALHVKGHVRMFMS